MISISIADNQPVVIQGIRCFFKEHAQISIMNSINHLKEIEEVLKAKTPSILIIDIQLDGLNTINSLKKIIKENPQTRVLIYTCASEKLFGVTSLKAGAAGFISKNESLETLEAALLNISEGKTVFSTLVHKSILSSSRVNKEERLYRKLSSREKEVLSYLINGKKNNEISELLGLNEKTISTYKLRLLNKLNVTNLIDLVNKAKALEIM